MIDKIHERMDKKFTVLTVDTGHKLDKFECTITDLQYDGYIYPNGNWSSHCSQAGAEDAIFVHFKYKGGRTEFKVLLNNVKAVEAA